MKPIDRLRQILRNLSDHQVTDEQIERIFPKRIDPQPIKPPSAAEEE